VTSVTSQDGFEAEETEIIVIDDGSDDDTAEIARKLDTILYINDHKGAAAARNTGISKAKGSFIVLLDADDLLAPRALKALSEPFVEDPELCGCFSKAQEFLSPELSEEQQKGLIVKSEPYGGTLPGCSLLRREVFEKTGLFDEGLHGGETVDWMIRFRKLAFPVKEIDAVTLLRRIHANNTGRLHRGKEMANYAKILRRSMAERRAENKQNDPKGDEK
jgi:glycosyltransferase involved in cell wall biosynthesis